MLNEQEHNGHIDEVVASLFSSHEITDADVDVVTDEEFTMTVSAAIEHTLENAVRMTGQLLPFAVPIQAPGGTIEKALIRFYHCQQNGDDYSYEVFTELANHDEVEEVSIGKYRSYEEAVENLTIDINYCLSGRGDADEYQPRLETRVPGWIDITIWESRQNR
jgi:hypothetical protein